MTQHWQDLKEVVIKKLNMNSGLGVLQTITMTIASVSFGYLLLKGILYIRRRQKNKRSSYGESRKITDNTRVNYERDGAAGVNIRIVNEAEGASEQQDDEAKVERKDKKAKRAKSKNQASSLATVAEEEELMDDVETENVADENANAEQQHRLSDVQSTPSSESRVAYGDQKGAQRNGQRKSTPSSEARPGQSTNNHPHVHIDPLKMNYVLYKITFSDSIEQNASHVRASFG